MGNTSMEELIEFIENNFNIVAQVDRIRAKAIELLEKNKQEIDAAEKRGFNSCKYNERF